jgi:hypothetical protein
MGRCYEFGAVIGEGCGHAMVVSDEGGHCVCPVCQVTCPGKFNGCAGIVAQPGYVPLSAPVWARPGASDKRGAKRATAPAPEPIVSTATADRGPVEPTSHDRWLAAVEPPEPVKLRPPTAERAVAVERRPTGDDLVPLVDEVASVRTLVEALASRPDRTAEVVALLHNELHERDVELAEAFGRLSDAYASLTEELARDRAARDALAHSVEELSLRIEAATRPLFGFKPRRSA